MLGLGMIGVMFAVTLLKLDSYRYCEVLNDDFSRWNDDVWTKEVELGGFG